MHLCAFIGLMKVCNMLSLQKLEQKNNCEKNCEFALIDVLTKITNKQYYTFISLYFAYYTEIYERIIHRCMHENKILRRSMCTNFTELYVPEQIYKERLHKNVHTYLNTINSCTRRLDSCNLGWIAELMA